MKAAPNGVRRRRRITSPILQALQEHLLQKPRLYLDKMALFI
jgi:hypothetical protein